MRGGIRCREVRRLFSSRGAVSAPPRRSAQPWSAPRAAAPSTGRPSRTASTISGVRSVSRSRRLIKLRVTPSAAAISAADRYFPSSNNLFHRCARASAPGQRLVRPWLCPGVTAIRRDDHLPAAVTFPDHRDRDDDGFAVKLPVVAGGLPFHLHAATLSRSSRMSKPQATSFSARMGKDGCVGLGALSDILAY